MNCRPAYLRSSTGQLWIGTIGGIVVSPIDSATMKLRPSAVTSKLTALGGVFRGGDRGEGSRCQGPQIEFGGGDRLNGQTASSSAYSIGVKIRTPYSSSRLAARRRQFPTTRLPRRDFRKSEVLHHEQRVAGCPLDKHFSSIVWSPIAR